MASVCITCCVTMTSVYYLQRDNDNSIYWSRHYIHANQCLCIHSSLGWGRSHSTILFHWHCNCRNMDLCGFRYRLPLQVPKLLAKTSAGKCSLDTKTHSISNINTKSTHTYIYTVTLTRIQTHTYIHSHTHTHMHTHTHLHTHSHTHAHE